METWAPTLVSLEREKRTAMRLPHAPLLAALFIGISWSCSTPGETVAAAGAAGLLGARTPGADLEQVYYLGVFDPREQLPPTIYRVTVRGQASILSTTKFASGWVPAEMVDTLSSRLSFDKDSNKLTIDRGEGENEGVELDAGRRLVLFGPEGFREAPSEHRLAIVMGSSPEAFFDAIDKTLGAAMAVQAAATPTEVEATNELLTALLEVQGQLKGAQGLEKELETAAKLQEGAGQ